MQYRLFIMFIGLIFSSESTAQKYYSYTKVRVKNVIEAEQVWLVMDTSVNGERKALNLSLMTQIEDELSTLGITSMYSFLGDPVDSTSLVIFFKEIQTEEVTLNRFSFKAGLFGSHQWLSYRYEFKQMNKIPDGFWQIWGKLSIAAEKKEKGIAQAAKALARTIDKALKK